MKKRLALFLIVLMVLLAVPMVSALVRITQSRTEQTREAVSVIYYWYNDKTKTEYEDWGTYTCYEGDNLAGGKDLLSPYEQVALGATTTYRKEKDNTLIEEEEKDYCVEDDLVEYHCPTVRLLERSWFGWQISIHCKDQMGASGCFDGSDGGRCVFCGDGYCDDEAGENTTGNEFYCEGDCVTSHPIIIDPDENRNNCTSVGGDFKEDAEAEYLCCGDDRPDDFGFISDKQYDEGDSEKDFYLCSIEDGEGKWLHASNNFWRIENIMGKSYLALWTQKWIECNASNVGPVDLSQGETGKRARFYCTRIGNKYKFVECCQEDDCSSTVEENQRDPGESLVLLEELDNLSLELTDTTSDFFEINSVDSLVYYLFLDLHVKMNNHFGVDMVFRDSIDDKEESIFLPDYVLNNPGLNKWMHVRLNLSLLNLTEVDNIFFRKRGGGTVQVEIENPHLLLSLGDDGSPNTFFCGGERTDASGNQLLRWTLLNEENGGNFICDSIPGYKWTGNECCGYGDKENEQNYIEGNYLCWGNDYVEENVSFTEVNFSIDGEERSYLCDKEECAYPTPAGSFTLEKGGGFDLFFGDEELNQTSELSFGTLTARNVEKRLLFSEGQLWGCGSGDFKGLEGSQVGDCAVKDGYFCSAEGWSDEGFDGITAGMRNKTKDVFDSYGDYNLTGIAEWGCCPENYCWNGSGCMADMVETQDVFKEHRCVEGEWVYSPIKYSWDEEESGYCNYESQCLVDLGGNAQNNNVPEAYYDGERDNPICINDSQFIFDHYCDRGEWTSRTKFLALRLLELVNQSGSGSNFTLYCDEYERSLIETDYYVGDDHVPDFLAGRLLPESPIGRSCFSVDGGQDCVNNFCVLKFNDQVEGEKKVFGVSLNKDINGSEMSFLKALDLSSDHCNNDGGGEFEECSDAVYYSKDLKAVIYGANLNPSVWDRFMGWLRHPIKSLSSLFRDKTSIFGRDVSILKGVKDFNAVYLARLPTKRVYGLREEVNNTHFLTVEYINFDKNICGYVEAMSEGAAIGNVKLLNCNASYPRYVVYGSQSDDVDGWLDIWQILTSRLRLSDSDVQNIAPVAIGVAEPEESEEVINVTLNGENSFDPNGDPFSYSWSVDRFPSGINVDLINAGGGKAYFEVAAEGNYTFNLTLTEKLPKLSNGSVLSNSILVEFGKIGGVCGNGINESDEECDDGNTLENDTCSSDCQLTYCGDSLVQNPNGDGVEESCDGEDLDNMTCQDFGFGGGVLSCDDSCGFDNSSCYTCGDGVCEEGEDEESCWEDCAEPSISCYITEDCQGISLFNMTDERNAHAGQGEKVLCCGVEFVNLSVSQEEGEFIVSFESGGGHASINEGDYANNIYLNTNWGQLNCSSTEGSCGSGESCVVTLSEESNAHVQECLGGYNYSVCCALDRTEE